MNKILMVAFLVASAATAFAETVTPLTNAQYNNIIASGAISGKMVGEVGGSFIPTNSILELGIGPGSSVTPTVDYNWPDAVAVPVVVTWNGSLITVNVGSGARLLTLSQTQVPFSKLNITIESLDLFTDGSIRIDNIRFDSNPRVSFMTAAGFVPSYGFEFSNWTGASHQVDFSVTFFKGTGEPLFQYPEFDSLNFEIAFISVPEPTTAAFLSFGVLVLGSSRRARKK